MEKKLSKCIVDWENGTLVAYNGVNQAGNVHKPCTAVSLKRIK